MSMAMELLDLRFTAHNVDDKFEQPENISEYFSLIAHPRSKIWRKSPAQDDTTAPMILTRLVHPFILAEVTIAAEFDMDWDQGGLVIFAGTAPGQRPSSPLAQRRRSSYLNQLDPMASEQKAKWVKAGLEFTGGELGLSTVVANPNCAPDWAFASAFPELTPEEAFAQYMPSLRIKFERVSDDLWVWYRRPDNYTSPTNTYRSPELVSQGWKKAREVMGFFSSLDIKHGIWVGCYASRPMELEDETEADGLFVEFEDLEIL